MSMVRPYIRRFVTLLPAIWLAACTTNNGVFEPACTAFEGDRIEIIGKQFNWDKFTDVLEIGDDGEPVKPFPAYPLKGQVTRRGSELILSADDNGPVTAFFPRVYEGERYLLNEAQNDAIDSDPSIWECALRQRTP